MEVLKRVELFIGSLLITLVIILSFGVDVYADEPEENNSFNSIVEIESYSVDGGYIEAGKESTISLTLHNANKTTEATNIIVLVRSNSGMVYPQYGDDNQFVVGSLKAGSSTTISIPIVVNSTFVGDYADFGCDIIYMSGGQKVTNSSTMILPGQAKEALVVSSLEVSAHAIKNNQSLLSIGYSNKGVDNINDAVIIVEGNISQSTNEIGLGSIVAGKAYTKDCNIVFTESGEQDVAVKLKYSNSNGEIIQSELGSFRVNVSEQNEPTIVDCAKNPTLVWMGRGIALLAFVMAVIVSYYYLRKH